MHEDYQRARRLGEKARHQAINAGTYPYLTALERMISQEDIAAEFPLGVLEIPLPLIVGTRTVGRTNSFACNFMPLLEDDSEFAAKWSSLYDSQQEEGIRDPIKCYEYMNHFYILEGNKRVSVMKYVGAASITADVIRLMPRRSESQSYQIYEEFLQFYKVTGLFSIIFSEKGLYRRLAKLMNQDLQTPWPADVIENLKYAFDTFDRYYSPRSSVLSEEITVSDAFLLYINVFLPGSLLEDSGEIIERNIRQLRQEFKAASGDETASLVEDPDQLSKSSVLGGLFTSISMISSHTVQKPLKAAFIYEKTPEESAWVYSHELGRNALSDTFGTIIRTQVYQSGQNEESFRSVLEQAAEDGNNVIFTTSPGMMNASLKSAVEHPDVKILNCSVHQSKKLVRTYYARMYEAKFLMGAVAAASSPDHRIGYVADYPIYGCIANINAFAIGAALVDPKCRIYLKWSSQKDADWKTFFSEKGISLISGADLIRPKDPGRQYGVYLEYKDKRIQNLAAPMHNWGKYYELILNSILKGSWENKTLSGGELPTGYWYGLSAGVLDVVLSDSISYYTRKLVSGLRSAIIAGVVSPFEGELHSQLGLIQATDPLDRVSGSENGSLSYEEIITMDWLNDNVIGRIPQLNELNDSAIGTVSVSGVGKAAELS